HVNAGIQEGMGFMGELARVNLDYERDEPSAPRTLIAKLPATAPENREVAEAFRFYEREVRFYEQIADTVELRTPRCYYSAFDPETGDYVLLLEDLAPARVGDQLAGCTVDEADLCITNLARFHATWWDSPQLEELQWMPYANDPLIAQSAYDSYHKAWPPFVEFVGGKLSPKMRGIGDRFGQNVIELMNRFGEPPRTIIHGDYRLDNMFFATPDGGDPLTVIDWQISSRGRGIFDLAYFACGTLPSAERKKAEMDLLRTYHELLSAHGVKGYSFDQCFEDYRASVLCCLIYAVIGIGNLDLANERGVELFMTIMQRTTSAIEDLNAGELLPA
ncbi:MAG: phosphotransferase, partial [Dehalococcoidia bacterium]|nr:phosphotransferase [Dehalococcoidia bacterium]